MGADLKTAELIRRLQEADPSGDCECVVGGEDIYFVEQLPGYYDGTPLLLVHDEALRDKCYSIVGARFMNAGSKVRIVTMGLRDVLLDDPELPVECSERQKDLVESTRAEMRAAYAKVTESERNFGAPTKAQRPDMMILDALAHEYRISLNPVRDAVNPNDGWSDNVRKERAFKALGEFLCKHLDFITDAGRAALRGES